MRANSAPQAFAQDIEELLDLSPVAPEVDDAGASEALEIALVGAAIEATGTDDLNATWADLWDAAMASADQSQPEFHGSLPVPG